MRFAWMLLCSPQYEALTWLTFENEDHPTCHILCSSTVLLLITNCHACSNVRIFFFPFIQEARGLDAGPRLVQKLVGFGDNMTSKIVGRIADEEMAHVAVGVDWFISICRKMNHAPCSTFKDILTEYGVELKGPFNYSARDEAGIPRDWYASSSTNKQDGKEQLSVVYDRLAHIISMESENSSSSGPA